MTFLFWADIIDINTNQLVSTANIEFEGGSSASAGTTGTTTPPSTEGSYQCNALAVTNHGVQDYSIAKPGFSGSVSTIQLWVAGNDNVNKDPEGVTSGWVLVETIPNPVNNKDYRFDNPVGLAPGEHPVLMTLHDSSGTMLDGNVGGRVNTACATSVTF